MQRTTPLMLNKNSRKKVPNLKYIFTHCQKKPLQENCDVLFFLHNTHICNRVCNEQIMYTKQHEKCNYIWLNCCKSIAIAEKKTSRTKYE